jgi:hypothetical protein
MFRVTIQDTAPGHIGSVTLDADFIPMMVEVSPDAAARMLEQVQAAPDGVFTLFPDGMTLEQAKAHVYGNVKPNLYLIDPRVSAEIFAWEKEVETEIAAERLGGNVVKLAAAEATKAAITHVLAILLRERQEITISLNAPGT